MITLKSPIVLNSISPIEINADLISQKIMGNYSVIGANITGEDLLHMTTQPPEVFVNVDNSESVFVGNSFNVDNAIKLELANSLFNRIMMYGTDMFTYQDEVFVSSVLSKMGITDVSQFMENIRQNMHRNELVIQLVDKFFEINGLCHKLVNTSNEEYDSISNFSLSDINNKYDTDLYIQNDIYKRLNTAACINTIYDYNYLNFNKSVMPNIADLTFIEQSDYIALSQFGRKLLGQSAPVNWNSYSKYEIQSLNVSELNSKSITKRILKAVMENIIDKSSYYFSMSNEKRLWKNYMPAVYKSSAQVMERFRIYQTSYENIAVNEINNYNENMQKLVGDEIKLIDLILLSNEYEINDENLKYINDENQEYISDENLKYINNINDEKHEYIKNENHEYINDARDNIVISMLENQNFQKLVTQRLRMLLNEKAIDILDKGMYDTQKMEFVSTVNKWQDFYSQLHQNKPSHIAYTNMFADYYSPNEPASSHEILKGEAPEIINRILGDMDVEVNNADSYEDNYITGLINQYVNTEYGDHVTLASNVEFLEQLNNHNVYMKQLLDSTKPSGQNQVKQVVVDRKKAMENAIKAIENPEALRLEVLEGGQAIERNLPEQIERILSITDEQTRAYYENLLRDMYNINSTSQHKNNINNANNVKIDNFRTVMENIGDLEDIENVENILNSIKSDTDIKNAVSKINNIISTLEENKLIQSNKKQEYITYLQSINEEILDQTQNTVESVFSNKDVYLQENILKSQTQSISGLLLNNIDNVLQNINENTKNFYEGILLENGNNSGAQALAEDNRGYYKNMVDDNIDSILTNSKSNIYENVINTMTENTQKHVSLIHAQKENVQEDFIEEITRSVENSKDISIKEYENQNESQITTKQIQEMKNELIRLSQENITKIVDQSIHTQVDAISDMVYLELEKRLRNEQRRRGY